MLFFPPKESYIQLSCRGLLSAFNKIRLGTFGDLRRLTKSPKNKKLINEFNINPKIKTRKPVGYLEMLQLIGGTEIVVTGSGGAQKEAFILKVPCVTARTETKWGELLHSGWNRPANPIAPQSIPLAAKALLDPLSYEDGYAVSKMADILLS